MLRHLGAVTGPQEAYDAEYQRVYRVSFAAAQERGVGVIGDCHVYAHRMALFAANSAFRAAQARDERERRRDDSTSNDLSSVRSEDIITS